MSRAAPGVASLSAPAPLRLLRLLLAAALLALLWPQGVSAKDAKFRITATWIFNYVEPRQRSVITNNTYLVTLKSNGSVEDRFEARTGNNSPGATLLQTETELGVGNGVQGRRAWKVINETTLVRLIARKSHTFAIWLRTQGETSCTATLEWRLKPGFALFEAPERPGRPQVRFTQPSSAYAYCEVL